MGSARANIDPGFCIFLQGVALNMTVNGKDYVVPMVLEEPSVVAAVGNVARMTRPEGFTAKSDDPVMVCDRVHCPSRLRLRVH